MGAGGPAGKGYISQATSRPPPTMPRKICRKSLICSLRSRRQRRVKNRLTIRAYSTISRKWLSTGSLLLAADDVPGVEHQQQVHQPPGEQEGGAVLVAGPHDVPLVVESIAEEKIEEAHAHRGEGRQEGERLARDGPVEVPLEVVADEDRHHHQQEEGEATQGPFEIDVPQSWNQPGGEHRDRSVPPGGWTLGGPRRGRAAGFGQSILLSGEERPQALPRLAQILGDQ